MKVVVKISKESFEKDLQTCLTIKSYPSIDKPYYTCVYKDEKGKKTTVFIKTEA